MGVFMFPDYTGSDVDYYERLNPQDPGHEFCRHLVDLDEATCYQCVVERAQRSAATAGDELSASDVLSAALVAMLKKIQERDDETMGAALAARFEKGSE
jgi:hypothetical protein